jgi:hypothetical protein
LEALPVRARLFCRGSYKYCGLRCDADFEIENGSSSIVGVKRLQYRPAGNLVRATAENKS